MATRPSSDPARASAAGAPIADAVDPAVSEELDALRIAVRGDGTRPGLVSVLPRLQRAHKKELIRREHWTSGDLARHPEPRELIRSWRRPGNLDEHGRLLHVFDARRMLVEDVHENRVVKHVVHDVRARLHRLASAGVGDAPELERELDLAVDRCPFLIDVGVLKARPTEPTATLGGDPLYRTVFQLWLGLPAASA
ncbi:MAG TPA: hypothetical protein VLA82_12075 [Actinomycetota bacterium]|nr:hypothetical protein [Actinomycetota bacterium]